MGGTRKRGRSASPPPPPAPPGLAAPAAVLVNALALLLVLGFGWMEARDADLYYQSLQEDEALEWATFWGFLGAALVFGWAALRERRARGGLPWFLAGLALFCFAVGMEEISWGQRVLGYRPPAYFLEHNFQQELNVHNVMSTSVRKLTLKAILLGYGVALPLLALAPPPRRLLRRLGVVAPPLALAPLFLGTFLLYQTYPWRFSGEIVEMLMGLGFLFAALAASGLLDRGLPRSRALAVAAGVALAVAALGTANAALSRFERSARPESRLAAERELEALRRDFERLGRGRRDGVLTGCGLHRRVYTFVTKSRVRALERGEFAGLVAGGLPEERAAFFLDPWNSPYWIRDRCSDDGRRRAVFLYSFGPNRKRESSRWEVLGDDVGAVIYERR